MKYASSILSFCLALNLLVATSGIPLVYRYCGSELYSVTLAFAPAEIAPERASSECNSALDECCSTSIEQEAAESLHGCATEQDEESCSEQQNPELDQENFCSGSADIHTSGDPTGNRTHVLAQTSGVCPMYANLLETCRQEVHVEQLSVTVHHAETVSPERFSLKLQSLFTLTPETTFESPNTSQTLYPVCVQSLPPPDLPVRFCSLLI